MEPDAIDADQKKIAEFLENECGVDPGSISVDSELFSSGLLQSLDLIKLTAFLEETFSISLSPFEVSVDELDTLDAIVQFVQRKSN